MASLLVRLPAVLAARGAGRSKLYDDIKHGLFTPPLKLGERVSVWPATEVEALNTAVIAGFTSEQMKQLVKQLLVKRGQQKVAA